MATDPAPLRPHPLLTRYYSDEEARRRQVQAWFDESAPDYDWITQAMSFGSGSIWKYTPGSVGERSSCLGFTIATCLIAGAWSRWRGIT